MEAITPFRRRTIVMWKGTDRGEGYEGADGFGAIGSAPTGEAPFPSERRDGNAAARRQGGPRNRRRARSCRTETQE